MANITFTLNGNPVSIDVDKDEELLWVLRDRLDVHGLKYGCGMGLCGACTSHIDGVAHRMCITPVGSVQGKQITTIDVWPSAARCTPCSKPGSTTTWRSVATARLARSCRPCRSSTRTLTRRTPT